VSDERKKVKSKKVSDELHADVAARLGVKPAEVAVFGNADGVYAVDGNGHRMLLLDDGGVAWYGDKAPNPAYPLVRPSVVIDESDVEEIDDPLEPGEEPLPADDVGANVALMQPVGAPAEAKKPGPPPRTGTAKK
jgi:hypothetical protein